ncbi:glycosyl hydrolase family 18 protein [Massilia sp. IC2-476]|uniref:glycosyl hydrolase family 18 protein n=1 Tax=Massilia sp. IC2-476 TaxID=2887199 RepID=UPI001D126898|nr:glycosyl hydrolase family 18 protein [Massilia sp. IC2-476]MCC2974405.1 cellulose binding domain-containing protein [Massilia sp. IC2-476]
MKTSLKRLAVLTLMAACASSPWAVQAAEPASKWVTGYYGGYFWDNGDYQAPEHVDMTAMTHFVFARIGPGGGKSGKPGEIVLGAGSAHDRRDLGPGAAWDKTVEEYMIMRAHQVGTKALIMLGGEGDNAGFIASSQPEVRPLFVKNLVDYMVAKGYDGVDVDWEGIADKAVEEQALLEALIADIRKEANARPRYQQSPVIITFPAGMLNTNIDKVSEHHKRVANLVDQYNFMSYGMGWFGQGWTSTTFAPLTGHKGSRPMSIASTIQMYEDEGIPRSKLGMGLGFYGMNYAPPYTGPDQETDGDLSQWSVFDVRWNYAQLHKHGYLDKGIYAWDAATQTSYRTYPGGYTPATRTDWATGYLSYEEPATIAAKGAWANSNRAGEGAAGTIIWLVNYGTTDGVNNPLLTATKKAFLDPNAVEPGPYPNPLPPAPVPTVSVTFDKPNDWGSGWCGTMTVKNVGDVAGWFVAETDFPDTITSLWNGTYTLENKKLVVKGMNWNKMLRPGDATEIGLCATRPAKPVEPPPQLPAGALTSRLIITGDWGSGYCAKVAVTNTSAVKAVRWSVQLPVQGTPSGMWNGKYTLENGIMTLSGADWNPDLAPGATNDDAGFCASR